MKKYAKYIFILLFLLTFGKSAFSGDIECGFKESCKCKRTGVSESFRRADFILEGKVISIKSVQLSEIVKAKAIDKIRNSKNISDSKCIKSLLNKKLVNLFTIKISKVFKGRISETAVIVCSPIYEKSCAYKGFSVGETYIIYANMDKSCDIYFTYSFDVDEYAVLKEKYRIWTNHCMRTKRTNPKEIAELTELIKSKKE